MSIDFSYPVPNTIVSLLLPTCPEKDRGLLQVDVCPKTTEFKGVQNKVQKYLAEWRKLDRWYAGDDDEKEKMSLGVKYVCQWKDRSRLCAGFKSYPGWDVERSYRASITLGRQSSPSLHPLWRRLSNICSFAMVRDFVLGANPGFVRPKASQALVREG